MTHNIEHMCVRVELIWGGDLVGCDSKLFKLEKYLILFIYF